MDIYLAGNKNMLRKDLEEWYGKGFSQAANGSIDVAILESFYYADCWTEKMIPKLKNFMLDSGAFTFFTQGRTVDWFSYIDRYIDFIVRNNVKLFFELDIDVLIGYENVKKLRKRLERGTKRKCIPVWHKSRGKEEFLRLCDEYDYVALGGVVPKEIKRSEYKVFPWFINEAHKRGTKLHCLGYTSPKGLEQYRFDSVDSSAWITGNRFGYLYQFNGRTIVKHPRPKGTRIGDSRRLAVHNFTEWRKFQKYAEIYL